MNRIGQRLRDLRRNQRGVTALEYALVAPLFFIALFMSIEVTFMLLADATLDTAANRITRLGKIGEFQGADCHAKVMTELQNTVSFWANTDKLHADVNVYKPGEDSNFGDIDDPDYQAQCDAGQRGDMVVFRIGFDKPGLTGVMQMLGADFIRYERTVVIFNEP